MERRILFFLLVLLGYISAFSQSKEDIINGNLYHAQIKLVDEFIERFNLTETRTDIDSSMNTPKNNLLLLFDLDMFPNQEDSTYFIAEDFIEKIIQDSIKINYNDGKWYARVLTNINFLKQKKQCVLYMTYVYVGDDMYKWQISGVESDLFTPTPIIPDLYVSPTAHEMEFMELSRVTKETYKYIDSYLPSDFEYSPLSAFSFAVSSGLLKIESVNSLEFVFEQVPGYRFYVSYFPRDTQNSGWLINNLERR